MEIKFEMKTFSLLINKNITWEKNENGSKYVGFIFLKYPETFQIDAVFLGEEKQLAAEENL